MPALGDVLRQAREEAQLSQGAVGELLGLDGSLISARERNRKRTPAQDLERLAAATGKSFIVTPHGWQIIDSPTELTANPDRDANLGPRLRPLPIAGRGSAGLGALNDDLIEVPTLDLGDEWLSRLDALVQVTGTSMEPLVRDGDYVGVRLDEPFADGDIVVAEIGHLAEVVVKVYRGINAFGLCQLHSLNVWAGHLVLPADEVRIRGVAYGLWRPGKLRAR